MRLISIILITITLTGCASTSFEDFGKQIDSAIKGSNNQQQTNTQDTTYRLTVQVEPSDSTVKIMNIKPKYYDGIALKSGAYDVLVQRDGYNSHRQWINISGSNVTKRVNLQALVGQNTSSSSPTTTQVSSKVEREIERVVEESEPTATKIPVNSEPTIEAVAQSRPKPKSKVKHQAKAKIKKQNQEAAQKELQNEVDPMLRADYRPPELQTPSELKPAPITQDEQPQFNGAFIKTVDEGFFSDTTQLVEMEQKPAYKSIIFHMKPKSNTNITWLLKQSKKYFAFEEPNEVINISLEKFQGIIFKGKNAEYVTLHRAERIVRGYDKNGTKLGASATFFDSNKNVNEGQAVYIPMDEEKPNKSKVADDSYFIDFKQEPKKGLYICWVGNHFWFFNLI